MVDMWSLGVILYIMLSGVPPFEDDDGGSLYRQILEGKFEFDVPEWSVVSMEAKELVQQLLKVNPRERLTIQQTLAHPWLLQQESPPPATKLSQRPAAAVTREAKRRRTPGSAPDLGLLNSVDAARGEACTYLI